MGDIFEECGIAGIYLKNPKKYKRRLSIVPELLYSMLFQLQHRGQLSAGISVYNPFNTEYEPRLKLLKDVGRVNDLFRTLNEEERSEIIRHYNGVSGTGHVRYATAGSANNYFALRKEAQPFLRDHPMPWKRFSIAFNGNLANYSSLRNEQQKLGYLLDTRVDTEIIENLITLNLSRLSTKDNKDNNIKPDLFAVIKNVMEKLDGAYSILCQFADGDMAVIRDPLAFKPLVYGESDEFYAIASESVALEKIGIRDFKPVKQGACMILNKEGLTERVLHHSENAARCHFEWVYFARAESKIDDVSVDVVRRNLGSELAKNEKLRGLFGKIFADNYIVVPVPDTAIPSAEAYSQALHIPISMAVTKTKGERGFINKEDERKRIMNREYGVISERVKGKKVIIIEDSIVRGETSKKIISLLRSAGAKEVHLRSAEPPILYPCFYGIDFPTYDELIAANHGNENLEMYVKNAVNADSVRYQTLKGLTNALVFGKNQLCLACLTGEYPTPSGTKLAMDYI